MAIIQGKRFKNGRIIKGKGNKRYCIRINRKGGYSIKPSNMIVNIKEIMLGLPEMAISADHIYSSESPLIVLESLVVLAKAFGRFFVVQMTKNHAIVLIGLWKDYDPKDFFVPVEEGFDKVNKCFVSYGESELSWKKYQSILDELVHLKCIEIIDNKIFLRESISITERGFKRRIRRLPVL